MKTKGKLKLLFLYLISEQGGLSSDELARRLGKFTGEIPNFATYRPLLSRLKKAGYIKDKNLITPEGLKYFNSLKEDFYKEFEYLIHVSDLINDKPNFIKRRLD